MVEDVDEEQDLVQQIFDQIEREGEKYTTKIELERDHVVDGRAKKHRVDIYWKFRIGEQTYLVIVEAKNSAPTVDLEQLFKLKKYPQRSN